MKTEYLIEGWGLGVFMISAAAITTLVEHPSSPIRGAIADPVLRRAVVGVGMGLTAISIVYSRFGQRSGAHINPAITLTYWRLAKIAGADAGAYVAAQFTGALCGLALAALAIGPLLQDPAIAYVATRPGPAGLLAAFAGEATISFFLMLIVLSVSNSRFSRYTGLIVGAIVACYITIEGPLSGMSMNPARTLAPAIVGGIATPLWLYFTAPPLGMLAASEVYVRVRGAHHVRCAKLHHPKTGQCLFNCTWQSLGRPSSVVSSQSPVSVGNRHS
jgi:aquaporin Z